MQGFVHGRAPKMLGVIVKMEIAAVMVMMMVVVVRQSCGHLQVR